MTAACAAGVVTVTVRQEQLAISLQRELKDTSDIANALELNWHTTCMKIRGICGELKP